MRVGVYGGSFDPVHLGHIRLAECCQEQAQLDRIHFVPTAHHPHKLQAPTASDRDRTAMLELAVAGRPGWEVSTLELDRGGLSFTVDTLRSLRDREPDAELFLLMGADALADLPKWREPATIVKLATPLVVRRADVGEPNFDGLAPLATPEQLATMRRMQVDMPATPISSSQIRRLIAENGRWHDLVPRAVADYIAEHGLYGAA